MRVCRNPRCIRDRSASGSRIRRARSLDESPMRRIRRRSVPAHDPLIPARLQWHGDQPLSRQFGDIYHAPDGAAEVERVFIEPQRLTQRFARERRRLHHRRTRLRHRAELRGPRAASSDACAAIRAAALHQRRKAPAHTVRVCRTGFAAWSRAADLRRTRAPLSTAHSRLASPPSRGRTHHVVGLLRRCIRRDSHDIVGRQRLPVDAWLLDGFAPDRNPELWSTELWRAIAALSADGTTIATFSAVGAVRRGLGDAGFVMRKIDQRPHKRHTLAGTFASTPGRASRAPRTDHRRRRRTRRRLHRPATRATRRAGHAARCVTRPAEPDGRHGAALPPAARWRCARARAPPRLSVCPTLV